MRRACYASAASFANYLVGAQHTAALAGNDEPILRALMGASEAIDRYCGWRSFGPVTGTRTYDVWLRASAYGYYQVQGPQGFGGFFGGSSGGDPVIAGEISGVNDVMLARGRQWSEWLWPDGPGNGAVMDLKAWLLSASAVTIMALDGSGSPITLTAGAANDYELREPDGAPPPMASGAPVPAGVIRLTGTRTGQMIGTPYRLAITGTWGYVDDRLPCTTAGADQSNNATTLTVAALSAVSAGQTLWIDSEQEFVRSIIAGSGSTGIATVERGVNGTTAAAHTNGTAISVADYPADVVALALEIARGRFPAQYLIALLSIQAADGQTITIPKPQIEDDLLLRLDSFVKPQEQAALVYGFA